MALSIVCDRVYDDFDDDDDDELNLICHRHYKWIMPVLLFKIELNK
jgi:hypothetical protein